MCVSACPSHSVSVCLSFCLFCLSLCWSLDLSVCISFFLSLSLSPPLSLSLSIFLSFSPSLFLSFFLSLSLSPSAGIFSGSSHTSDLNIGTPVATLPGAWRYRVSTGTGRPGVSILWLGEMESLICSFYLSVAARKLVCADPSLRYTCMLLGR